MRSQSAHFKGIGENENPVLLREARNTDQEGFSCVRLPISEQRRLVRDCLSPGGGGDCDCVIPLPARPAIGRQENGETKDGQTDALTVLLRMLGEPQAACVRRCLHLIRTVDARTFGHSINVGFYSMLTAQWLGLAPKETACAVQSGLLHDLGKISVPDKILKKPGALTEQEYAQMRTHVIRGYMLLSGQPEICAKVKNAVLFHHERMDGSGYPFGTVPGEMLEKIVAVADVFDAITSERVYKKAQPPSGAFSFFLGQGAALFDRTVAGCFVKEMGSLLACNIESKK